MQYTKIVELSGIIRICEKGDDNMMNEKTRVILKKSVATILSLIFCVSILASPKAGFTADAKNEKCSCYTDLCIDKDINVLFIGDSRTVDMFSATKHDIKGKKYNNITVYAQDGGNYDYMKKTLKKVNLKKYDVIVSWMGANDRGNFDKYESYYKKLSRKKDIKLVLCTIGYSDNNKLGDMGDILYYNDYIMQRYNKGLTKWAKKNEVETIDLYKYTKCNVEARANNGVHYVPSPTVKIWNYAVKKINKKVETFDFDEDEVDVVL